MTTRHHISRLLGLLAAGWGQVHVLFDIAAMIPKMIPKSAPQMVLKQLRPTSASISFFLAPA